MFLFKQVKQTDKFLFISQIGTEKWILGAKARRLSRFFNEESKVLYSQNFKNLPVANGYYFLHQKYFSRALRYNPFLAKKKCFVMFTHPVWNKFYSKNHAAYTLRKASKVICLNQKMANELIQMGIKKENVLIYHLASNPEFFSPKEKREGNTIGFCSAYYERKNPELICDLVLNMPDYNFLLVGKDWDKYDKFDKMLNSPNFRYVDNAEYEDYPSLYKQMDVFCSPSFLEGGPVPLLEAMLSNLIPVASNTGFCPDIIRHGDNGFLFDPYNDSLETVMSCIKQAFLIKQNVRNDVIDFSWEKYGEKLHQVYLSL